MVPLDDAEAAEAALGQGLAAMLAIVDPIDSIASLVDALDRHEMPNLYGTRTRDRAIEVLRELEAEAAT